MAFLGAALGALGGVFGSPSESTSVKNLAPAGSLETFSGQMTEEQLRELNKMAGAGVTSQDTVAAANAQRALAAKFGAASEQGLLPTQQDIATTGGLASQLFNPQQLQLQQAFQQQSTQNQRLAAQLGRSANDPILAAKLAQAQTQQQGVLNAQQGAFGIELAMQQPGQRLGLAQSQADTLNALSQQAMSNRQAVAGLGAQVRGQEQQFRLGSASTTTTGSSGGGIGGLISGGLAGYGAFSSIAAAQQQAGVLQQPSFAQATPQQNIFTGSNPYAAQASPQSTGVGPAPSSFLSQRTAPGATYRLGTSNSFSLK